jgi:putative ATP-dependent endonuclease of OLD family
VTVADEKVAEETAAVASAVDISTPMYLSQFSLEGFRSCREVKVPLRPTLTLIVGENNAGKSNIIEALRLATTPLSGRRTRYFEYEDVHRSWDGPVVLSSTFEGASKFQRAQFIGGLDIESGSITQAIRFHQPTDDHPRGRTDRLAGLAGAVDPEPEKREQINHVYLAPLRDAQRELDSGSGTRLASIIRHLVPQEHREAFVAEAQAGMKTLEQHPTIQTINQGLQGHLTGLTDASREQVVGAGFDPPELARLARSLRLKMAERDVELADLSSSGLGYANLLFMATVILELQNAKDSELTVFLVEEPEAHLHPQLQAVLLDFLLEQAEKSVRDDSDGPAGRIQVIATTHSPNLASAVGSDNVVVVRSIYPEDDATSPETVALALAHIDLSAEERRKIDQYLDVTRSELLFARRVLLVEGIAEAVLFPALATNCVFAGDTAEQAKKRRQLRGATNVAIGSVDFSPYLKLLLSPIEGHRLADVVLAVTDGDPDLTEVPDEDGEDEPADPASDTVHYNRAGALTAMAEGLGAADGFAVAEAPHTLEADLLVPGSSNSETLGKAYLLQHPRSRKKWANIVEAEDPAEELYRMLRADKKLISKGQFAHDIAVLIAEGAAFTCPDYIAEGLKWLVGDDE